MAKFSKKSSAHRVFKIWLKARCVCCSVNVREVMWDMSHKSTLGEGAEELGEMLGWEKSVWKHVNNVVPWRKVVDDYWVLTERTDLTELYENRRKLFTGEGHVEQEE